MTPDIRSTLLAGLDLLIERFGADTDVDDARAWLAASTGGMMNAEIRKILDDALAYHATPEEQVRVLDWLAAQPSPEGAQWTPVEDGVYLSTGRREKGVDVTGSTFTAFYKGGSISLELPDDLRLCRKEPPPSPER